MYQKNDLVILTKDVTYGDTIYNAGMVFAIKQYDDRIKTAVLINNKQQVFIAKTSEFESFEPDIRVHIPLAFYFDSHLARTFTVIMTSNSYYVRTELSEVFVGYITELDASVARNKANSFISGSLENIKLIWTNTEYIK